MKILQIFPKSVLILPEEDGTTNEIFTNSYFESNISKLQDGLKDLKKVEVSLKINKESEENHAKEINTNLLKFALKQQSIHKENKVTSYENLKIKPKVNFNSLDQNSDSENEVEHIYNVNTVKVEWEGAPSYMHVFINITDIVKLNEAQNNIRSQRIMFASASHEFRTPLNAISTSFDFADYQMKNLLEILKRKSLDHNEIMMVNKCKIKAENFIKMGRNSSTLLLALIDDILDLSKMDAGTFKININEFEVSPLLHEVYSIFQNQ